MKTAEVRSRPTRVIGERFWIYASKGGGTKARKGAELATARDRHGATEGKTGVWSLDLLVPAEPLPAVILERAEELILADLPTGVSSGRPSSPTAPRCPAPSPTSGTWPTSSAPPAFAKPARHPQPVWFKPF